MSRTVSPLAQRWRSHRLKATQRLAQICLALAGIVAGQAQAGAAQEFATTAALRNQTSEMSLDEGESFL